MTDDGDIDGLAAEYALGSLHPSEREAVNARRKRDVALNEAIAAWEQRLDTLSDRLPGVAPPADLYAKILTGIAATQPMRFAQPIGFAGPGVSPRSSRQRRTLVAGIVALAACLLLAVGWVIYLRSGAPGILVAQLHRAGGGSADEAHLPAFAVTIDPNARTLTIQPMAVRPVSGRRYALWLMQQGEAMPIPLGNVSPSQPTTLPWRTNRKLGEFVNSRVAISLEQEGGPLTQQPTTPITFAGTLVGADAPRR